MCKQSVVCDNNIIQVSFIHIFIIAVLLFRNFIVIGILKMGWKKMNLCDNTGSLY